MQDGIYQKLREPLELKYISWKINNYNKDQTKAMITFHVDARAVQHRLNEVLGFFDWEFKYTELEKDEGVHGILTIYDKDHLKKVTREDVGYASTTNKSEWYKDAVSDALKRCAVHFGVGHFLYALPMHWINLNEPGQKFLTDSQNGEIKIWLESQLSRMDPIRKEL